MKNNKKELINEGTPLTILKDVQKTSDLYRSIENVIAHSLTGKNKKIIIAKPFGKFANGTVIKDADTLIKSIEAGALAPKTIGQIETGLLKYGNAPVNQLSTFASSLVNSPQFIKKYSQLNPKELKNQLKANGYSDAGVEAILQATKKGQFKDAVKKSKQSGTPNNTQQTTTITPPTGDNNVTSNLQKALVKSGKIATGVTIVKFALLAGGIGGLYAYFSNGTKIRLNDKYSDSIKNLLEPCLRPLLSNGGDIVLDGDKARLILKKTGNSDYDSKGGVVYYPNGRVWTLDKSQKGTWSCQTPKTLQEAVRFRLKSLLKEEVDEMTLAQDVDTMIDYLDTPVSTNDLKNALEMLTRYSKETINGKNAGKVFLKKYEQGGFGGVTGGDMKQSLKYLYIVKVESKQYKDKLLALINQIESGKSVVNNGSSSQNGVNIIWDKESLGKVKPTQSVNKKQKESITYKPCTDFPFNKGCISQKILDIQQKLNFLPKHQTGYFGNITYSNLVSLGYDLTNGLTKELYDKIMGAQVDTQAPQTTEPGKTKVEEPNNSVEPQDGDIGPPEEGKGKVSNEPTQTTTQDNPSVETKKEQPNNAMREYLSTFLKRNMLGNIIYNGAILDDNQNKFLDNYVKERFGNEYNREKNTERIGKNRQRTVFKN